MWNKPTRREFSALAFALAAGGRPFCRAQGPDAKADAPPAVAPLPPPEAVPDVKVLPTLPTVPVRRAFLTAGAPAVPAQARVSARRAA